jgi:hypothetical protein
VLASGLIGSGDVANAAEQWHAQVVSAKPYGWTPHVLDGVVSAIAVVGDIAVVGGRFGTVREARSAQVLHRRNLFAFQLGTGRVLPAFVPRVDGHVLALEAAGDGSIYVGGAFRTVNSAYVGGLARLRLSNGSRVAGFMAPVAAGDVRGLARRGARLYVGGAFRRIGGVNRGAFARLNAATGTVDRGFDLRLRAPAGRRTIVKDLAVSRDGRVLVLDGSFTSIAGRHRDQLAVVDVNGRQPRLRTWFTDVYGPRECILMGGEQTYINGLDLSPDGTYFVVVTGGHLNEPWKTCDTAARFNVAGGGKHSPVWVNHTGANTLLSVAVTGGAVYVGGHNNWLDNTYGWKTGGPGAVRRPGIGAIDPATGRALPWNPTHDRGRGVGVLVAYPGGLLAGSDTEHAGNEYHARLCGFPVPGLK